ncbi:MAG: GxxExxY protein [Bacteroidota bacterium]
MTYEIIGAAIEVHKELGPGLLESVYHKCLKRELETRQIFFKTELCIPIRYKDDDINADLKCDFIIDDCIVVEIKSVETLKPIFEAQLLTYMKLLKAPKGILINFNVQNIFKEGQKTFVNEYFRTLTEE